MANPNVLAKILHKLQRINALIGSAAGANLAADIAAVNALVVTADAVTDGLNTNIGAGSDTHITNDIETIRIDALTKAT